MAKDLQILAKKIGLEINAKAQIVAEVGEKSLKVKKGDKIKLLKKDNQAYDDLVVLKDGENLIITYADGSTITLEGFYALEDVSLELPVAQNEVHLISSNYELSLGVEVIYAQGDMSKFHSFFEGNSSYLTAVSEYKVIDSGLAAAGESEGLFGLSTATLVIGGLALAGIAVAVASNSSSSSSSNVPPKPEEPKPTLSEAHLEDSAVAGADYVAYNEKGEIVAQGTTGFDGKFNYLKGGKVLFKIGDLTLADIKADDIKKYDGKGIVTLQDLAGVSITDTNNALVKKMAQLLQSLDADGNAANGIQIIKDKDSNVVKFKMVEKPGDKVTEEAYNKAVEAAKAKATENKADIVLSKEDSNVNVSTTNKTVAEILTNNSHLVSEEAAKKHLDSQIKNYVGEMIDSQNKFVEAVAKVETKKILLGANVDASAVDTTYLKELTLKDGVKISLNAKQVGTLAVTKLGENSKVELKATLNKEDLTKIDLSNVDNINLNGKTEVKLSLAQATKFDKKIDANYDVVDSVASLLKTNKNIDKLTKLGKATVKIDAEGEKDLSAKDLHSKVNAIDLNKAEGVVLNAAQSALVVANSGVYTLKDTAAKVEASAKNGVAVELTDAASVAQLKAIKAKVGEAAIKYTEVKDSATKLLAEDAKALLTDKTVVVSGISSVAQLKAIKELLGKGELKYETVADSLEAVKDFVSGDVNVNLTDAKVSVADIVALDAKVGGAINAKLEDLTIAQALELKDSDKNVLSFKIKDDVATVAQLSQIAAKVKDASGIDASKIVTIKGDLDGLAKVIEKGMSLKADFALILDSTSMSADDLIAVYEKTSAKINVANVTEISGTIEKIKKVKTDAAAELEGFANQKFIIEDTSFDLTTNAYVFANTDTKDKVVFKNLETLTVDSKTNYEGLLGKATIKTSYDLTLGDASFAVVATLETILADNKVKSLSFGHATPAITGDTIDNLKAFVANEKVQGAKEKLAVTITKEVADVIKASDIVALAEKVKTLDAATNVDKVSGTAKEIVDANTASALKDNFESTLTGGAESAKSINALNTAAGTGTIDGAKVTSIEGRVADITSAYTNLDTKPTASVAIVSKVDSASATDLSGLIGVDKATSVDASKVAEISGANADVKAVFAKDSKITKAVDVKVSISDAVTVEDLNAIKEATSGKITADVGITLTEANVNDAISSLATGKGDDIKITYNHSASGQTVGAATIIRLIEKTSSVDKVNVGTNFGKIKGSLAELSLLVDGTKKLGTFAGTFELVASGDLDAAKIVAFQTAYGKKIDFVESGENTILRGSAENLKTILTDDGTKYAGIATTAKAVVTGDTATVADLSAIGAKVASVNVEGVSTIEGAHDALGTLFTDAANKYTFKSNVKVKITGSIDEVKTLMPIVKAKAPNAKFEATFTDANIDKALELLDLGTKETNVYKFTDIQGISGEPTKIDASDFVKLLSKLADGGKGSTLKSTVETVTSDASTDEKVADVFAVLKKATNLKVDLTAAGVANKVSVEKISTIAKATTGEVKANVLEKTMNNALKLLPKGEENDLTVTLEDSSVSAKDIVELFAKIKTKNKDHIDLLNSENKLYIKELSGSADDLSAITKALDNIKSVNEGTELPEVKVLVSGELDVTSIGTLVGKVASNAKIVVDSIKADTTQDYDFEIDSDVLSQNIDLKNYVEQTISISDAEIAALLKGSDKALVFETDSYDKIKLDAGWQKAKVEEGKVLYTNKLNESISIKVDENVEVKTGETVISA